MMGWLKDWLTGIIAAAAVLAILYALIPKGAMYTVARFTGGLILLLAVLRPLVKLDPVELKVRYRDYQQQVDDRIEQYREENQTEMAAIIEDETAAYISKKTAGMGISCRARVETELHEGVPVPCRVSLSVPRSEVLSRWIEEEIGIPQEAQIWEVEQ